LKSAELPYRILVESMNEGALTLTSEGMILYSNFRFAEMVRTPLEQVIGASFLSFVSPEGFPFSRDLFEKGKVEGSRGEVRLKTGDNASSSAVLSFRPFNLEGVTGVCLVVTDITAQNAAEQNLLSMRDRLRSLAAEMSLSEERERRRIASFLHDRIGPTLSLSQFRLEALQDTINAPDYNQEFNEIRGNISRAIDETRSLTGQLYPQVLYGLGLSAAVDWLGEQIEREYGVKVAVLAGNSYRSLSTDLRGFLYHSARELVYNAVKHAGASAITITIGRDNGMIHITVEDNGKGFDASKIESSMDFSGGFGLFSIRERLSILGGKMEISSEIGKGSRFILTVPVELEAAVNPESGPG
ncbi:MAG: PAS domain-containing sensor histidine kinase, partial [Candidatus Latescibacterota bacterium]